MKRDLYRWGIMGAGIIARKMTAALAETENAEAFRVGSKDPERARRFAMETGIPRWGDYRDLVTDPEVDIVYVATTHNFHAENALLAMEHGKHLLIEKPITVNAVEAERLMRTAREKDLFLMEALWTRFLPSWQKMREIVRSGGIGEVRLIDLTFGKFVPPHFEKRLNDPDLAGGASLDLGVYALTFCAWIFGALPDGLRSTARLTPRGVDELATYQLSFPSGGIAQIATGFNLRMSDRATIYGTRGEIEFTGFPGGSSFVLARHDGGNEILGTEEIALEQVENGFRYQVEEVIACLDGGVRESTIMPPSESTGIIALIDGMRREWGMVYPNDG
ncbi:MAG: Gfo/Idh/MocA family protein [Alkalispirochaeta sp.]